MKVNPIKKQLMKREFETTDLTIEQVCEKFKVKLEDLGPYSTWQKELPEPIEVIVEPTKPLAPVETATSYQHPQNNIDTEEYESILDIVDEAKREAAMKARDFFKSMDFDEVSTKEFKDMTGVLKDIESGEFTKSGKDKGPTINVLVQNMMEKFIDDV